jgi:CBS domain-containing protein
MISDPVTLSKDHTLAEAKELMANLKFLDFL